MVKYDINTNVEPSESSAFRPHPHLAGMTSFPRVAL
jgi:hypothetical protein